jgi:N-acetyl-gamma-glutamyl-phosphate reductase
MTTRVGLVGVRGHVGKELVAAIAGHPHLEIAFIASRTHAGAPASDHLPGAPAGLLMEDLGPEAVADKRADAVVLALPNDHAPPFVAAIDHVRASSVIVDVSSDHRFDDAWVWGLPELGRAKIAGARRIANPGCYATAAALALAPVADLLDGPAHAFGVSGYSGAGTAPSPRNDVEALRDNLMPYALVGHTHEREVSRHVAPVFLMPHVAAFFRGITMTLSLPLRAPIGRDDLEERYRAFFAGEPLVTITPDIPLVRAAVGRPGATIGGFAVDPGNGRAVVVSTLDNLLKGAATQALQNLNLALGFPEREGIDR